MMHWGCVAAHKRPATYWHMLPEAAQARKAIWTAINPHTGKRRIDEAFPDYVRAAVNEQEMFIRLRCGSTWQVVGSDNFNSLVGSPPAGVVYSEWALANPAAQAYLRPILAENGGWSAYIYTPRGRNHGLTTYETARDDPKSFAQVLTVDDTDVFTKEGLSDELRNYIKEYGQDAGSSMFRQEYYCSFDAAILGAIYGVWIERIEQQGRIRPNLYDPELPVHTAWDLGFDDSTAIWWWQVAHNEVRLIDYYEANGKAPKHYTQVIQGNYWENKDDPVITNHPDFKHRKKYNYGRHYVPHDAAHKLLQAGGRSIVMQAYEDGVRMEVVAATSHQNSINALRKMLDSTFIDTRCAEGTNALRAYQFSWDDDKKVFAKKPRHDWSSHGSDACEIIGRVWQNPKEPEDEIQPKFLSDLTANDVFWPAETGIRRERI
jgi:phage terminase large subunit